MATELGQAYVQIIPSAKGISGAIQNQLDPEATEAGQSAGSKLGAGLKIGAIAAIAATGAALGKIISSSLTEGADLQQSIGGIETLFKGSADKLKQFADDAYKTSGLSANKYMENVTSFSASLLQSMGGDTDKAADKANMAMIDMSDNANKMGTNMEDIQNAYQGFSKSNYTMLDNLKIGYGGTKEEMERLLADATKLTGVKYDINNLSDVYDAVHAVQEELDITGTTAKEASETFRGSFAAMTSSFSNVLGNLALGEKLQPSLNALADTTATFLFDNFIPMTTNILKGLPEAIGTFIQSATPRFLESGKQIMTQLGVGMGSGTSDVIQKLVLTITPIINSIKTAFGQLPLLFTSVVNAILPIIDTVAMAITKLDFSGLQAVITSVIPAITNAFNTMMEIIRPAIDMVVGSFSNMWNAAQPLITLISSALMPVLQVFGAFLGGIFKGILMGVSAAFDVIKIVIQALTPIVSFLVEVFQRFSPVLTTLAEWIGTTIGMFTNLSGAGGSLSSILSSAWNNIKMAVSTAGNLISLTITSIKSFFSALGSAGTFLKDILMGAWNGIRSVISNTGGAIGSIVEGIKNFFSSLGNTGDIMRSMVSSAWNSMHSVISNVGNGISSIIDSIKSFFSGLGNAGDVMRSVVSSAWNSMKSAISSVSDGISSIIEGIKNFFTSLGNAGDIMSSAVSSAWNGMKSAISNVADGISSIIEGIKNFFSSISNVAENMSSAVSNAWNNMRSAISNVGDNISGVIDRIKGMFDSLTNIDLFGAGSAIMDGFLNGLKQAWGNVTDFVGGIADWIAENKGPISYDQKLLIPAGNAIMNGLNHGLKNQFKIVQKTVSTMGSQLSNSFDNPSLMQDGLFTMPNTSKLVSSEMAHFKKERIPFDLTRNLISSKDDFSEILEQKTNVVVQVEGDSEWLRAYVNEKNALDNSLKFFS